LAVGDCKRLLTVTAGVVGVAGAGVGVCVGVCVVDGVGGVGVVEVLKFYSRTSYLLRRHMPKADLAALRPL
jgi:hypothetical protein